MKPKRGGKVGLVVRPVRMGWAYSIIVTAKETKGWDFLRGLLVAFQEGV
jgi:hypothetical protein